MEHIQLVELVHIVQQEQIELQLVDVHILLVVEEDI